MYKNKGNTKIIALVSVLVIFALAWLTMRKPSSSEADIMQYKDENMTEIEKDVINTLAQVGKINLDDSVLKSQAFAQLVDISRSITEEPIGRANPFAPVDPNAILENQDYMFDENTDNNNDENTNENDNQNDKRTLQPRETQ